MLPNLKEKEIDKRNRKNKSEEYAAGGKDTTALHGNKGVDFIIGMLFT